jgi:hypothetical protein
MSAQKYPDSTTENKKKDDLFGTALSTFDS